MSWQSMSVAPIVEFQNLKVQGKATVGSLALTDDISFNNVTVTENLTVGGTATVDRLIVTEPLTYTNLDVTESILSPLYLIGNDTVNGSLIEFDDHIFSEGGLTTTYMAVGSIDDSTTPTFVPTVTLNNDGTVTASGATFSGDVTILGTAHIGILDVTQQSFENLNIPGTLNVEGDTTLADVVTNDIHCESSCYVAGDVHCQGLASYDGSPINIAESCLFQNGIQMLAGGASTTISFQQGGTIVSNNGHIFMDGTVEIGNAVTFTNGGEITSQDGLVTIPTTLRVSEIDFINGGVIESRDEGLYIPGPFEADGGTFGNLLINQDLSVGNQLLFENEAGDTASMEYYLEGQGIYTNYDFVVENNLYAGQLHPSNGVSISGVNGNATKVNGILVAESVQSLGTLQVGYTISPASTTLIGPLTVGDTNNIVASTFYGPVTSQEAIVAHGGMDVFESFHGHADGTFDGNLNIQSLTITQRPTAVIDTGFCYSLCNYNYEYDEPSALFYLSALVNPDTYLLQNPRNEATVMRTWTLETPGAYIISGYAIIGAFPDYLGQSEYDFIQATFNLYNPAPQPYDDTNTNYYGVACSSLNNGVNRNVAITTNRSPICLSTNTLLLTSDGTTTFCASARQSNTANATALVLYNINVMKI